jgi:exopolysaccharide biosynthesis polyprenyl glycosylphosphotransferase
MKLQSMLRPIMVIGDSCIFWGAFLLAYQVRFALPFLPDRPIPPLNLYFQFAFLVAFINVALFYSAGMYRLKHNAFGLEGFFCILRSITFGALIIMAMNFALKGIITRYDVETYSRLIVAISWVLSLGGITLWRWGISCLRRYYQQRGRGLRRVVIVGTDHVARGFYKAIQDNVDFGYYPIGFVTNGVTVHEREIDGLQVLGGVESLPAILKSRSIDEVVLACVNFDSEIMAGVIKTCERTDVQFSMIPGFFEILTHQMRVEEIADIPVFQLEERIFQRWGRLLKRSIDIGLSFLFLVAIAPIWMFVALSIKLESKGPVLFRQVRVGKGEKLFYVYKFRSMCEDADTETKRQEVASLDSSEDVLLRVEDDPRVTRVGRFLRRFSIDEHPQVINVLKGEMSWVGPRPHIPEEVKNYKEWHRRKYDALPGITGLTQVSGRKNLPLDDMVRLDIYYIENWSPLLDFQILLKTIPAVLWGRGAY